MNKRTIIAALLLIASMWPAKAVDPVDDAEIYPGSLLRVWIRLPRYSTGPTTVFYDVANITEQTMNYRVQCTLDNPRLYFHNVYSRWVDNVKPRNLGYGKAELAGFVDAAPHGLHCRITDGRPTPTPLPDDRAAIKVTNASWAGVSMTLHYRLTSSRPDNTDYQIECRGWSNNLIKKPTNSSLAGIHTEAVGPVDVITQWVVDVAGNSEVEGTVYSPDGNEYPSTGTVHYPDAAASDFRLRGPRRQGRLPSCLRPYWAAAL
jgi:hypothetical protein